MQEMHDAYWCMRFATSVTVYFSKVTTKLVLRDSLHRPRTCSCLFLVGPDYHFKKSYYAYKCTHTFNILHLVLRVVHHLVRRTY
jgi:hypothetical protein